VSHAINAAAVAALADEPIDWRFKGLPPAWSGSTPAQIGAERPNLFDADAIGPVCVLRGDALAHNLAAMATWCGAAGVELAPHGKTHMAPQLMARQLEAGACAITVATAGQLRVCRAFGVRDVIMANELVDAAGLRWLAAELDSDREFGFLCWVDSVRGVEIMAAGLAAAEASRPIDVCVEIGMPGGRTGCRSAAEAEEVGRAAVACPQLRLVCVAGYEAARGHDLSGHALAGVAEYLGQLRDAALRLADLVEISEMVVTAGGSTYFDVVAETLTGWPDGIAARTILRSGCYLTHDDGLYARTSPLTRAGHHGLTPALSVWAQVVSRPESDLAVLTMGRRDVSFDQDLPVPYGLSGSHVDKLNDQHAYLRLGDSDRVQVGDWIEFGISHPCTTFDKWPLIPVLDEEHRVVDLIRTFF
jgi:D-serine deaminase-like pyridoxal phosphate-dependent protein